MVAADDIGMLALPAEASGFCQRLFHDRRGIDKYLYLARRLFDQPAGGPLEGALDDIMIILALSIDRNPAVIGNAFQREGIRPGSIAHSQHNDRPDIRPQMRGIGPFVRPVLHPDHIAVTAIRQPLLQPLPGFWRQRSGSDADRSKALFLRLYFKRFVQS